MHRLLQREVRERNGTLRDGINKVVTLIPYLISASAKRGQIATVTCQASGSPWHASCVALEAQMTPIDEPCQPQSILSNAACLSKAYPLRHQDHMAVTIRNPVSPLSSTTLLVDTRPSHYGRTEVDLHYRSSFVTFNTSKHHQHTFSVFRSPKEGR